MKKPLSRRTFFKTGLGAVGAVAGSKALAQVCGLDTGEQPLGPFFPQEGTPTHEVRESQDPNVPVYLANDNDLTFVAGRTGKAEGQVVYIKGRVLNENCEPIPDASIIIWQASKSGRYNHKGDRGNPSFKDPRTGQVIQRLHDPNFQYWGRTISNQDGGYIFKTIVPGFYPADLAGGWYRPPHIHFMVAATGYPQLVTQMYFKSEFIPDDDWNQELNKKDFLLQSETINNTQREALIVQFYRSEDKFRDGLIGGFDITLKK